MKRLIVLLATLLLSFGLIYAAPGGVGSIEVKPLKGLAPVVGDTIYIGKAYAFDFLVANDVKMGGFQLPFLVTASGGAAWTWTAQAGWETGLSWGDDASTAYFTVNTAGRMNPPATIWSLTSGFITNMTQAPNKLLIGGTAGSQPTAGSAAGPAASAFRAHFTATLADEGVVGEMCLDKNTTVGPAAFVFSNMTGGAFITMTYPNSNPAGKWCFPVKKMANACPEITGGPSAVHATHCGKAVADFTGQDDPLENDPLTWGYALISGAGTVTQAGGHLEYDFAAGEISGAVAQIEVYLSDNQHGLQDCAKRTLIVTADNVSPTLTCGGASHTIPINQLFTKSDIVGGDVDLCDDVTYSIVGPGAIDPVLGVYTWTPVEAEVGLHTVVVTVTDGAATAECSFTMNVVSFTGIQVIIEKTEGTLQGHYETVNVSFGKATNDVGGFDLLIGYDASGLNFVEAELSADLKACKWEYFTYRYNWNGNCGNGCPSGLLRLVGLAETNNGPSHPDAQCLSALQNKGIATLTFLVSNDRNLECQYLPIRFYWMDCTDNTLSDLTGDTLYMARDIYNFDDNPLDPTQAINFGINVTENSVFWPGYYGWAAECWPIMDPILHPDIKQLPLEYVDFIDGGIDVVCADSIDARGDINLNGIANEVADAVMFTNYFILGLAAFGEYPEGSIAASDVNADGISLSVADLVYLIRVIVGDALPYAKPVPGSSFAVSTQVLNGQMTVDYTASNDAGAVLLVFNVNGTVGTPVLGSDVKMDIASGTNGNELRVLVYNIGHNAIPAGTNELLTIPVSGSVELVSVEAADFNGGAMEASTRVLPSEFGLNQNYPNPFNPKTVISFSLPTASNWNLAIYNVAGQMVKQYNDYSEAGSLNVTWDGTDNNGSSVASGIYFYKMTASNFSATKKMVLMK